MSGALAPPSFYRACGPRRRMAVIRHQFRSGKRRKPHFMLAPGGWVCLRPSYRVVLLPAEIAFLARKTDQRYATSFADLVDKLRRKPGAFEAQEVCFLATVQNDWKSTR